MGTSITITVQDQDRQICYERVVNSILDGLPDDYEYLDDVFDLKRLAKKNGLST
jgi:hypothetical protein